VDCKLAVVKRRKYRSFLIFHSKWLRLENEKVLIEGMGVIIL
jgi:hypothetical protein